MVINLDVASSITHLMWYSSPSYYIMYILTMSGGGYVYHQGLVPQSGLVADIFYAVAILVTNKEALRMAVRDP